MHFDEDLIEIMDAQIDRLSEDEDMIYGEAKFKARQRISRTASRYIDEEDLFDDIDEL